MNISYCNVCNQRSLTTNQIVSSPLICSSIPSPSSSAVFEVFIGWFSRDDNRLAVSALHCTAHTIQKQKRSQFTQIHKYKCNQFKQINKYTWTQRHKKIQQRWYQASCISTAPHCTAQNVIHKKVYCLFCFVFCELLANWRYNLHSF